MYPIFLIYIDSVDYNVKFNFSFAFRFILANTCEDSVNTYQVCHNARVFFFEQ